ncbi:hypothetical protein D9757_008475 [Collybiopsis confluens]|uniref:Uncharacterized protein n=1 Tax=Collybiopsis confluens TaxID=2823264 RepID=A0A8H5HFI7_9AGAR|nr:hypothetical protein D9757_008475 [Collybiopsis confluens]
MSAFTTLVFLFALFAAHLQLASSSPVQAPAPLVSRKEQVAWSPSITYPHNHVVLTAGKMTYMSWKTTNIPAEIQDKTGTIILGYLDGTDTNEHLDLKHPLVTGVKYTDGNSHFTVPKDLPTRNDYIFVFMGDSGNASPKVTILQSNSTSNSNTN